MKPQKRARRRLTTKVSKPSIPTMSFEPGPSSRADNKHPSTSTNKGSAMSANTASSSTLGGHTRSNNGQMVFDSSLGLTTSVECSECKMHFNSAIQTDVAIHEKHHKDYLNEKGIKSRGRTIWEHPLNAGDAVVVVDRNTTAGSKAFAMKVLEQTREDMGGDGYNQELWTMIPEKLNSQRDVPRYKVYIYFKNKAAVAVLLAERIFEAGLFYSGATTHDAQGPWPAGVKAPKDHKYQEYANKDETRVAYLMVDRIWTKQCFRRQGLATKLIDLARDGDFMPAYSIPRKEVAFSWPTHLGEKFASQYQRACFKDTAFLVGFEDAPHLVENDQLRVTGRRPRW